MFDGKARKMDTEKLAAKLYAATLIAAALTGWLAGSWYLIRKAADQ